MTEPALHCRVCGDPAAGCRDLESATPAGGWCPCLERALAAAHAGVRRLKNGSFPAAWYDAYYCQQHRRWLEGLNNHERIGRLSDLGTND